MQIGDFETFTLDLDLLPSGNGDYAQADGVVISDRTEWGGEGDHYLAIPWEKIPGLVNALQYALRQREAAVADGTVAAVLLQDHVANAPGDFS